MIQKKPFIFRKKLVWINDNAFGTCDWNSLTKFKATILKSIICNYSVSYNLVERVITSVGGENRQDKRVIFKNYTPFTKGISETDNAKVDKRGGFRGGTPPPPIFCNHLFFYAITLKNYMLLFKVELIIKNAPLTYVYPNTFETCLTPIICYLTDNYYILLTQHQV